MVNTALFVKLEAKPGKEKDVENFLQEGLALVQEEHDTVTWYALRLNKSTYAIFDTFPNEKGRQAHLAGAVAKALMNKSSELFQKPPIIEKIDVLAAKLPGVTISS